MTITPGQLEKRKDNIGSSDAASILGVGWQTPYELFLQKTGQIEPPAPTPQMLLGNIFEGGLIDYAVESGLIEPGRKGPERRYKGTECSAPLLSHLDFIEKDTQIPVEVKTSGLVNGRAYGNWGDENGSDQVPEFVIAQVHHQMLCVGAAEAKVLACLGGIGLMVYRVRRDDSIMDQMIKAFDEFWECVLSRRVPPEPKLTDRYVYQLPRIPEKRIPISAVLVQSWLQAKEEAKEAKGLQEELRDRIRGDLGDAEFGDLDDGQGSVSHLETVRAERVNVTVAESRFRTVRFKKPKAIKIPKAKARDEVRV